MTTQSENSDLQRSDCNEYSDNSEQPTSNEQKKMSFFGVFFRGLLMGSADAVPGVSGGTIALIVGIYQRLITAISHFDFHLVKMLCTFQIRKALVYTDFGFLFPLICGIGTALVAVLSSMNYLLNEQRVYVLSVFFGLIAASCILVLKKIHLHKISSWVLFVLGAVFAFWLVGQPFMQGSDHAYLWLFVCGMIAICAMVLPGISGSYILLILGEYTFMSGLVKQTASELLHGHFPATENMISVAVFLCGCVVGIIGFTKILKILLAKFEQPTLALLCGFMAGSLRSLWPFQEKNILQPATETTKEIAQYINVSPADVQIALIAAGIAIGAMTALLLIEFVARKRDK
ncbi:MAG: DUF368 domain-containing protein [Thermoguttaceae bacterium]|nr:DUF368 domain-containing protein [Thermoguttaceae bacterium]